MGMVIAVAVMGVRDIEAGGPLVLDVDTLWQSVNLMRFSQIDAAHGLATGPRDFGQLVLLDDVSVGRFWCPLLENGAYDKDLSLAWKNPERVDPMSL